MAPWQILEGDRQLAPPVGVLIDSAGQVGLLLHADQVLELDGNEPRARAREEEVQARQDRVGKLRRSRPRSAGANLVGRQPLSFQNPQQQPAIALALMALNLGGTRAEAAEALALRDIAPLPPAAQGRQVVRGDASKGRTRVGRGCAEPTVLAAFEVEHAVALDLHGAH